MKRSNKIYSRASLFLLHRGIAFFIMVFFFLFGSLLGAEKNARKVVRVAYQEFNRQMIVDEHNNPVSGYAYDYIQTIGTYAGWDLKYIPCDSFADSVKKLLAGEVDLIYEISYTEERAKEILFPAEPMGFEYYYLYSTENNTSITPGDYKSMDGKNVGVTSGTTLLDLLKDWCGKKNVNLEFVEYESISEKESDLFAGKIDLDLELGMLAKNNLSCATHMPDTDKNDADRQKQLSEQINNDDTRNGIKICHAQTDRKNSRVLIADDVPLNLAVLKALITRIGIRDIVTAVNGQDAWDKIRMSEKPFDLVLTDMWMPKMDGKDLASKIREDSRFVNLPVYAVTADIEEQKSFEEHGFTGILLKPVTLVKLSRLFN